MNFYQNPAAKIALAMRRRPSMLIGMLSITALILLAAFGPIFFGESAGIQTEDILAKPNSEHWFGTDQLGRDLFSRTLVATRLSVILAVSSSLLGSILGSSIGIGLAMAPNRLRNVGLRAIDGALAFPGMLMAIVVTAILGVGAFSVVIAIALAVTPAFARLSSNLAMSAAGKEFVENAHVVGVPPFRIFAKYLLPPTLPALAIAATYDVGLSMVLLSSLSFLGLGVQLPDYDWGRLLLDGISALSQNPTATIAPAVAIALSGLAFAFVGDAFAGNSNSVLVPRSWRRELRRDSVQRSGQASMCQSANDDDVIARVEELTVEVPGPGGSILNPVRDVSFSIHRREIVGIVGESGSGKSLTAASLAGLLPYPVRARSQKLELDGIDLHRPDSRTTRKKLVGKVSMVFQNPLSSLNPSMSVGRQMTETVRVHDKMRNKNAEGLAVERLSEVYMSLPRLRLKQSPHELSGGMRQRVMTAMGLMRPPTLLIADEPTTALDVTVQAQLLEVLREVNRVHATAILLVSHDIGVIASICDRVLVMYAGQIIEQAATETIINAPQHPYTRALIASVPEIATERGHKLATIVGSPPTLEDPPIGCPFAARCPEVMSICIQEPPAIQLSETHLSRCWLASSEEPRTEPNV